MKSKILFLHLFIPSILLSQTSNEEYLYSQNYLSSSSAGRGYTGIGSLNDISGIVLNPASFEPGKKGEYYIEYVYKSKVNEYEYISFSQYHPSFFIGAGFKPGIKVNGGITFYSNESFKSIYKTFDEPEQNSLILRTLSAHFTVKLTEGFRIGFSPGITFKQRERNTYGGKDEASFSLVIGMLGIPAKNFSFGVNLLPITEEREIKVSAGVKYGLLFVPLNILADYHFTGLPGKGEINNFHFGIEYVNSKKLTLRTGFLQQTALRRIFMNIPSGKDIQEQNIFSLQVQCIVSKIFKLILLY